MLSISGLRVGPPLCASRFSVATFAKRTSRRTSAKESPSLESPLSVLSHDLEYLEEAFGVDLHAPLETVAEAHDQVVCTLNPHVAEQRSKELDSKLQELHAELSSAHSEIHEMEAKVQQSLKYVTDMEQEMSRLASANPDMQKREQNFSSKKGTEQKQTSSAEKRRGGIENSLNLGKGLKEHWYPVEFSSKLEENKHIALELFGDKWVICRSEEGQAICLQEGAGHRSSQPSVDRRPDGRGQCPGSKPNSEAFKAPLARFCDDVTVPVVEADGFVWIWPGETEPTPVPHCANPPQDFQIHAEMMLEVPVEHGLLLENLLDLAHAPFTHTSTFAKGWPIPDVVRFHTSKLLGGNWDPYPIDMSFETPCMVVSLIGLEQPGKIERGARAASCAHHLHQLHVCLPTNDRSTRLLYRMSLDFLHWTRSIPGIQKIWSNVAKQVLGEDLVLVEGQQDRMLRGSSVWRNPVTYDKLGIRYRRWRNATSNEEKKEALEKFKTMSAAEIFSVDDQS